MAFNESGSRADATRADFIRAQCADAPEAYPLFQAHAWRWAGLSAPPADWKPAAEPLFKCFDRGVMTRLRLDTAFLPAVAALRQLLRAEPVAEVEFAVGSVAPRAATAVRTLLPFPRPIRATVTRAWTTDTGPQGAFLAALLSSPVLASATELDLNGVNSGWTTIPLVNWLARSPFLNAVRSLNLASNRLTCADARALVRVPKLRKVQHIDVTKNLLGDCGSDALRAHFGAVLVI